MSKANDADTSYWPAALHTTARSFARHIGTNESDCLFHRAASQVAAHPEHEALHDPRPHRCSAADGRDRGARVGAERHGAGDAVRLESHARFQTDLLLTDQGEPIDDRFESGRRRIGVDGELFDRLEFQVERELEAESPWRDIYGEVKTAASLAHEVRCSQFRVREFSVQGSGFRVRRLDRRCHATPNQNREPRTTNREP